MGKKNRVSGYWLLVKDVEHLTNFSVLHHEAELIADSLYTLHKEAFKMKAQ